MIVNNSYRWYNYDDPKLSALIQTSGMLFVASAGNEGYNNNWSQKAYPASYDAANIISVAATTAADTLAVYSNHGTTTVDLGDPGGTDGFRIVSTSLNHVYKEKTGTSMAAPLVAGVAGLLKTACPQLSLLNIKQHILNSVDPMPALQGIILMGGRLNAFRALQGCAPIAPPPTPGPNPTPKPTPTPQPHTTCGTDDAEAGWYFVYSVGSTGSCGGLIDTNWQWFGPDTAKVEVEFRNGIRPAKAWCVPGHASLSVVPEHGHWYYTCTLSPAGNDQVYVQWRW